MTFGEDPPGAGCSVADSEKILGDFFAARPGQRDRVVLASKFFTNLFPGDPSGGAGRGAIIAQLDAALRRLRTDYLDL
jgi:aryl-alcohol dehydrogenase-like predicted oxidoreductase